LKLSHFFIDPVGLPLESEDDIYLPQSQSNSRKPKNLSKGSSVYSPYDTNLMRVKVDSFKSQELSFLESFLPFFLSDSPKVIVSYHSFVYHQSLSRVAAQFEWQASSICPKK